MRPDYFFLDNQPIGIKSRTMTLCDTIRTIKQTNKKLIETFVNV